MPGAVLGAGSTVESKRYFTCSYGAYNPTEETDVGDLRERILFNESVI